MGTYAVDVAKSDPRIDPELRIRERTENVAVWGLFLALPIERVVTVDVIGFTLRPVYLFMGLLIVLNARRIPRSGVAGLVGAGLALAVGASALTSLDPRQTAGYAAWGTFTIGMTIPIGFVMGFYLQRFRPGAVAEVSLLGVALLIIAVLLGRVVAQSSFAPWFEYEKPTLVWLLAGYGFLASVLPGWMLLVPRGYLSTFMKLGVVFLLGFGVIALAPTIQMPRMTTFAEGGGPIIPGNVFPFLFITIACGAVSGFHALVASGTTPKMIEQESQALVGYAAMLLESFVGVMALVAATVLLPGDYFSINTTLSSNALASMGFPPSRIDELSRLVEVEVAGRPGGAVSLAVGMASIFSCLPGMAGLMAYWYQFALLFEALFILTTIDTGTRVARYLIQEMAGRFSPSFRQLNWMPGAGLL